MIILNLLFNLLMMVCLSVVVLGLGVAILTRGLLGSYRRLSGHPPAGQDKFSDHRRVGGGEER